MSSDTPRTQSAVTQLRELCNMNVTLMDTRTVLATEMERIERELAKARWQRDNAMSALDLAREAIRLTLEENRHLADGENCTLARLKQAYAIADAMLAADKQEARR